MITAAARRPTQVMPFPAIRPARKRSWLDRLLRRPRPDLAIQAMQNLLARRGPASVSGTEISNLMLRYGVAGANARCLLVEMWQRVLSEFLADNSLSDKEIAYLDSLRTALTLTQGEAGEAERRVIHPRYAMAVGQAMADRFVSAREREQLAKLAAQLRLPPEVERDIYERVARRAVASLVRESVADRRLSPEEREELAHLTRHLGVAVELDHATEAMLDRYALFWSIENGRCPAVEVPITLEKREVCYFCAPAVWYRPLQWRLEGDFREGIGSVRVARGVYYRCGSATDECLTDTKLKEMDRGKLYITSRRVIFEGARGTIRRGLRSIDAFLVYRDGLVLEKANGRGFHLTVNGDVEMAAVVLGAALSKA